MKIYQVTLRRSEHEHDGYAYYTDKRKARAAQEKVNKESYVDDEVYTYDFPLTKEGVLELLSQVASHPDNG